nr:hypothetical protein [Candidatus Sigynarchaeota archaeon]
TACNSMFNKYLQVQFKGNLKDFELVADVLANMPDNFDLFEKEEIPEQTNEIYEAAALDLDITIHDDNGEMEDDPWLVGESDYEDIIEPEFEPEHNKEIPSHEGIEQIQQREPVPEGDVSIPASRAAGLFSTKNEPKGENEPVAFFNDDENANHAGDGQGKKEDDDKPASRIREQDEDEQ